MNFYKERKHNRYFIAKRAFKHSDKMQCPVTKNKINFTWTEKINFDGEEMLIEVCRDCCAKKELTSAREALQKAEERRTNPA